MKRRARYVLLCLAAFLGLVWLNNTSLFSAGDDKPLLIAHRGLAPEMHPEHEDYRACLSRIHASEHSFIENTIPSMEAAFDLGADYVEFDVRTTADGQFAVFHDDVLDCKTDATGRLIDYSMADLKALDIGYGYYTESNEYPLRGKGIGLMPSLEDVLDHFPLKGFVINVKNNDRNEAVRLGDALVARGPQEVQRLLIFGGSDAVDAVRKAHPSIRAFSRATVNRCLRDYMIYGWTGYVPDACRNTAIGMYVNYAWALWGWPHRLVARMRSAGTTMILTHPYQTESVHDLPETSEYAEMIPRGYGGAIQTNRIDKIQDWLAEAR